MANRTSGLFADPATRVLVKVVVYYIALLGVGSIAGRVVPLAPGLSSYLSDGLFTGRSAQVAQVAAVAPPDQTTLAGTVLVAMLAAILLSVPVAWVYQLTRAKRGYQQSVVQLLIMLPVVVAGIVVLVKYSVALAFSLAGIVAAVRFRNTLDDSKDAVYVFLATGIGLAAAVDIPVAAAISVLFNATIVVLWYSDFGHAPVELEGGIAARRLQRAKELARTGTFVAQIDAEVLRNMTREQLEGLAERAWRRARDDGTKVEPAGSPTESRIRVRSRDIESIREAFDPQLDDYVKEWRVGEVTTDAAGIQTVDYFVEPKKSTEPEELLALMRATCGSDLIDAELE
jgi:hypothetical protein